MCFEIFTSDFYHSLSFSFPLFLPPHLFSLSTHRYKNIYTISTANCKENILRTLFNPHEEEFSSSKNNFT